MIEWLKWLFGGIGVAILFSFGGWLFRRFSKRQSSNLGTAAPQVEKPAAPIPRSADFRPTPTPLDVYTSINRVLPFDRERTTENYLGIPVRWQVRLDSISKESPDTVGVHSSNNNQAIFCKVSIAEYPRLKIAKAGDPLELTGFIERISIAGLAIVLRNVEIVFLEEVHVRKDVQLTIPKIQILSHSNGSHVGWHEQFSGSVEPSGSSVQVFVFSPLERRFWKQWTADVKGTQWRTKCQFGNKADLAGEYDVIAVTGGEILEGGKSYASLPDGDIRSATVRVLRTK